jgi:hypothetical protein
MRMREVVTSDSAGWHSRDLLVAGAALALMLAAAVVTALLQPPATPIGAGSTFNAGPAGTKAAFLALARMGYRVERSFEPLAELAIDSPANAVVIVVNPPAQMSAADQRVAREFVERGGTLLATGKGGALLPGLRTITFPDAGPPVVPRDGTLYDARPDVGTTDSPARVLMTPEAVLVTKDARYQVLYEAGEAVGVVSARIGAGRAIWWTGSDPVLNSRSLTDGHMELFLEAVGQDRSRRVIWNEFYHGFGRSFWSYVAGTPAGAIVAQLSVVALVAVLTYGRRRGPVRSPTVEQRTSVLEFVDALSALYRKAGARAGAVEAGLARTRRVLAGTAGLPAALSDAQLAAGAAARAGMTVEEIAQTLDQGASAARDPEIRPAAALDVVRRLQDLSLRVQNSVVERSRTRH